MRHDLVFSAGMELVADALATKFRLRVEWEPVDLAHGFLTYGMMKSRLIRACDNETDNYAKVQEFRLHLKIAAQLADVSVRAAARRYAAKMISD